MLTENLIEGGRLAREHLDTLREAQPYPLDDATVTGVIQTWQTTRDDLAQLFAAQGRRWTQETTGTAHESDVANFCSLVDKEIVVVDEILVLAAELQAVTIERLLAKSDLEVGLEALGSSIVRQQPQAE